MLHERIVNQVRKRNMPDITRKAIFFLSQQCRQLLTPFKRLRSLVYFKNAGVKLGRGVILSGLSYNIQAGKDVNFYDYCIVEIIGDAAALLIGNRCVFSYGVLISCQKNITIGNDVMIGEYTSVRDTSHTYKDITKPMKGAEDISNAVIIGNDVWIGRGCVIMDGTVIEDGVVVAANSVVKGRLIKQSIYGGAPARFIRHRTGDTPVLADTISGNNE